MFIYASSKEYRSTKFCADEFDMYSDTVTDCKSYKSDVCASSQLRNPVLIGGPGKTVQVDESCFSSRKFEVGRV